MPRVSEKVVIVGAGETRVGKLPGLDAVQIQAWAVQQAAEDCGVRVQEIDGLINLDPYAIPNSMFSSTLSEYLGLRPRFLTTVDVGGTVTAMAMVQQGIWAVESGHCDIVACVYGENALTGRPAGAQGLSMRNLLGGEEWEEPFGVHGMVTPYALLAQRYLAQYGATAADFAEVAMVMRRHALHNPNAQMTKPMSHADHASSRMISTPLRLLDCSLVSDGGGAVVLMRQSEAERRGLPGVAIRSMAMRGTHNSIAQAPDLEDIGMAAAGADAFDAAGMSPGDMHVALLHDAFTISVLLTLEALRFAAPGKSGDYLRAGHADMGGRCPLNPHGGLLSQAHIGGMLHVTEAVHQLRGTAGTRQVADARRAVVSGNGGVFSVCGVMIMEACA